MFVALYNLQPAALKSGTARQGHTRVWNTIARRRIFSPIMKISSTLPIKAKNIGPAAAVAYKPAQVVM
ncbi:MAG: hypothetical protein KGJ57_19960 [Sphingomonadales bacterium]|nr:hypothetical protein [Sphingomonadales bacterium]MDE2171671.1 hypothetical protein [Sphingomonadales bacterium]